jgi:ADP-L-glycero-D-manno-heptose 6-epimerase
VSPRLVLVTGGAGFIGSNIVAELAADPALDIVVCDRMGGAALGKWRNLAKHPIVDFIAPEDLFAWLAGRGADVEAIIHMGAVSSTTEADADLILATNFALSRDLFAWCAAKGRRLMWASSGATYGDGGAGFDDDDDLAALAALRPLNAYGWSKALFDLHAVREAARGRAPRQWTGLKFFNVYGPNEGHKGAMASLIAQMWPDVAAGASVKLFRSYRPGVPDGGQRRDFIYVRDVARAVAWLFRHGEVNGVFNLGSGAARSFEDLALAVFKAAGRTPAIDYVEMPPGLRGRYQYLTQARMARLRTAGYAEPFMSLEDGVADYVERFLAAPDPYR